MNEFLSWSMLYNRPWDTQTRLSDAETERLFALMADPSLHGDAMSIDMADGYLTAIAVGPSPIPVYDWLEDVFAQPTLLLPHDPKRQQRLLRLLLHCHADIQAALAVRPAEVLVDAPYPPPSSEVPESDCITPYQLSAASEHIREWELKHWAEGFRQAVAADDDWQLLTANPDCLHLLGTMVLYYMGYNQDRLDFQLEAEGKELLPSLGVSVFALRDWWWGCQLTHGSRPEYPVTLPTVRDTPRSAATTPAPSVGVSDGHAYSA